jgi:transcriptional regulator with XRE-family HTH domain
MGYRFSPSKLRKARSRLRLSQNAIARQAEGFEVNALERWEQGRSAPKGAALIELADILGIDPRDLFDETIEPAV